MSEERGPGPELGKTRVASAPKIPAQRASTSERGCFVVIVGPKLGVQVPVEQEPVEVGRDPACSLTIDDDDLVSRRHARVEWVGDHHRLSDLGSTNGTYVNDERVTTHSLRDGDRVGIGKVVLKYLGSDNIEAEFHQEMFHLMAHDGLTGIHNKRHFDEALRAEAQKAHARARPLGLIVFDIDHFKSINDTHGHAAGDAVLRKLAATVQGVVVEPCLFARVGGEEFSVLCPGLDHEAVSSLSEKIRAAIEATTFDFGDLVIPVTASVGAATRAPGSDENGKTLYEAADAKLYEAKNAGRNRVASVALS